MAGQGPHRDEGRRGMLARILGLGRGLTRAARTPSMAPEDVAVEILAHLGAKGSDTTHGLYMRFEASNGLHLLDAATGDTPGYVPLVTMYEVLRALREQGRVRQWTEPHEGRETVFWALNPWGGRKGKAGSTDAERQGSGGLAPALG